MWNISHHSIHNKVRLSKAIECYVEHIYRVWAYMIEITYENVKNSPTSQHN